MTVAVTIAPQPIQQVFVGGIPAAGGSILTQVGGVNYPTYEDQGVTPLPNPIPLNSRGEVSNESGLSCQLFLVQGVVYTFTYFDAQGNQFDEAQYVATPNSITQASIGFVLYPQTAAEIEASVTPSNYGYPEGDIRRYGALTSATDNSGAVNSALSVSSNGGNAAFIPGGTWPITNACLAPAGSSIYGMGTASVLSVANGIDGLHYTVSDAGLIPRSRFCRDFQIIGTLTTAANAAHGIYINASVVDVLFSNVSVLNFQWGVFCTNLYDSVFFKCFIQNCYQGIFFQNQSVNIAILDCTIQLVSNGTLITATGNSTGVSCQGSPAIERLIIQGGSIYGYNYNINLGLCFEIQIEAVDISFALLCPIYFASTIDGLWIRDCWIELASSAAGTWNNKATLGDGNLTGIFIAAITPSTSAKVHIVGNYINSDVTITGSTGVYIGNANNGITVQDNQIIGFDVGIGGGNTLVNNGGTVAGASIKNNTVNTNTTGILIGNGSTELDLGPNYILTAPSPYSFTGGAPASMVYSQPNAPMQGTIAFAAATSVAVTLANNLPFSTYQVSLSGNPAGYCWVSGKGAGGFTINCSVSNSNSIDWSISA